MIDARPSNSNGLEAGPERDQQAPASIKLCGATPASRSLRCRTVARPQAAGDEQQDQVPTQPDGPSGQGCWERRLAVLAGAPAPDASA